MTAYAHTWAAYLGRNDTGTALPVISGSVTIDEAWSPRVQATLITSDAAAASIDPRTPTYVTLVLTRDRVTVPTSTIQTVLVLTVRTVSIDHITRRAQIELAGQESLLADYLDLYGAGFDPSPAPVYPTFTPNTWFARLSTYIGWPSYPLTPYGTVPVMNGTPLQWGDNGVIDASGSALDYASAVAAYYGKRFWWDGQKFVFAADADVPYTNRTISNLQLVACTSSRTRDDGFADGVVVNYNHRNAAAGTPLRFIDVAGPTTYTRVLQIDHDSNQTSSTGEASRTVARTRTRGRTVTARTIADYSYRPLDHITVLLPDGYGTVTGVVSAVTFDSDSCEQTVTVRDVADLV